MKRADRPLVLVVDDRRDIFEFCERFLGDEFEMRHTEGGRAALALLESTGAAAVLLDRDFSRGDPAQLMGPPAEVRDEGLHILAAIRRRHPLLPVLMVTGLRDTATAARAAELAADFLPWEDVAEDPSLLGARLRAAIDRDGRDWRAAAAPFRRHGVVVESAAMGRVVQQLARALGDMTPVLLQGPTGSGKDCLARALHAAGRDASGPFVEVNAATLDAGQLNNELFGHAKGSYTDAKADWKGLLASADGGTFFLNEVADLPLESQAKLLTVLESGQVRPLGSARYLPARFRLVSATSRDLCALVVEGRFREDLWHRLAGHTVALPPLCERREDVPPLAESFLRASAAARAGAVRGFAREAIEYLQQQPWSGNVRSLQRTVEVAAAGAVHTVTVADVRAALMHVAILERAKAAALPATGDELAAIERVAAEDIVFAAPLRELLRAYYFHLKQRAGGNMAAAARLAGIAKSTMCEWRDRYDGAEGDNGRGGDAPVTD